MTEEALYARPTLGQRLRWQLGYGYRALVEFGPEPTNFHHWAKTVVVVRLDYLDRLRLMLTGALQIDVEHRMSAPVEMESISSVCLIGPGDRRLQAEKDPSR